MYDPHVKDLKERERLRKIWEPLPLHQRASIWTSGSNSVHENNKKYASPKNSNDYIQICGNNKDVYLTDHSSSKVVDFWKLSNGLSTSIPRDALTPFSWSHDSWFPSTTMEGNTGCQAQEESSSTKCTIKEEVSCSHDDDISSLNALVGNLHDSHNDSMTMTTPSSLPQTDSLWFSTTPLMDKDEAIETKYRWLTDSIGFIRCNPFYSLECALRKEPLVLKIENIPWVVSTEEIQKEFDRFITPSHAQIEHCIHIMMDTSTGKTDNKAFMQIIDCDYNCRLLEDQTSRFLHCRRIKYAICSQDEFLSSLYPSWSGSFHDGKAILSSDNSDQCPVFVTQRELQNLSNVCRNYKLHFNRKSGERPFLYMKSLVLNLPWYQERVVTTAQRDIIYEAYKIMARYLADHSTKQHTPFNSKTVNDFVRPTLVCCGFTPKQRRAILQEAHAQCPPELSYSIKDPIMPQLSTELTL